MKEKKTVEELKSIFELSTVKERLNENFEKEPLPFVTIEHVKTEDDETVTYICPDCGKEFSQHAERYWHRSYDINCPFCGYTSKRSMNCTTTSAKGQNFSKLLLYENDSEFYIADFLVQEELTLSDELMPIRTFEDPRVQSVSHIDKWTKNKTSFKLAPTEEYKLTRATPSTLYGRFTYGDSDPVDICAIGCDGSRKYLREVLNKYSVKVEYKVPESTSGADLPREIKSFFPVTKDEYFIIETKETGVDYVNKIRTISAHCHCCDYDFMTYHNLDDYSFVVTCPECGVSTEYRTVYHYRDFYKLYVSDYADNLLVQVVRAYNSKETGLHSTLQAAYVITPKGTVTSYIAERYYGDDSPLRPKYLINDRVLKNGTHLINKIEVNSTSILARKAGFEYIFKALQQDGYLGTVDSYDILKSAILAIKYPVCEKLIKAGYSYELLLHENKWEGLKPVNKKAETINEALNLSKGLLKSYRKFNQTEDKHLIKTYESLYGLFPTITPEEVRWAIREDASVNALQQVAELVPDVKIGDIVSYLERVRLTQMFYPSASIPEYRDYLSAAKSIGMDMHDRHVLYPRALKTEHDIVVSKQRFINDEETQEKFLKAVEKYTYLEYHKDDYFIRVPNSTEEMLEEGRKLHHCCGRYVDDVSRGTAFVLFLRKKAEPETPYLSMEILPEGTISQVRGLNDSYVHVLPESREVNAFLNSFATRKHLLLDLK